MIYEKIFGWFDFQDIYDKAVKDATDDSILVEVGSYLGRSTAYMAEIIKNSGKNPRFYAIDIWDSTAKDMGNLADRVNEIGEYNGKHIFDVFLNNLDPFIGKPGKDYLIPLRLESKYAVQRFLDETVDFCFLDATKYHDDVIEDLTLWYPKIKPGKIIAGHDYLNGEWPEVKEAVDEFFGIIGKEVQIYNHSFLVVK